MTIENLTPTPVPLPNGIVIHHVRAGEGPALIFIHGAMGDYRSAKPQWSAFSKHFDCISYSRRYSFPNPNPMQTREHSALIDAEDLEGLMDCLDIGKAILVGSSYGGFTALAMAVRAPHRVAAIVSVEAPMMRYADATPAGAEVKRAFLEATADPAREAFERGEDALGAQILTGGIVGKKPSEVPAHVMERRMQNIHAARSLALSEDEFPLLDRNALGALEMPIMLLTGAKTAPVHSAIFDGVRLALPQARTMVVEGAGHSVAQQCPEVFNRAVMSFLAESGLTGTPDLAKA